MHRSLDHRGGVGKIAAAIAFPHVTSRLPRAGCVAQGQPAIVAPPAPHVSLASDATRAQSAQRQRPGRTFGMAAAGHAPAGAAMPSAGQAQALLSVRDVSVRFGGIVALDGVSFDVHPGPDRRPDRPQWRRQDHALQLPVAALHPERGDILFEGRSILKSPRHAIASIGMGRTFQNVALFDNMTVLDNVKVGCHSQCRRPASRARCCSSAASRPRGARDHREGAVATSPSWS